MNVYKGYNKEEFLAVVNDATLPSVNPLKFTRNLLKIDC